MTEKLIIDGEDTGLPGYGVFRFSRGVQLTKSGEKRSRWKLPTFFKKVSISGYDSSCFNPEGYSQSVSIGQEFIVSESKKVMDWAYKIIRENINMHRTKDDGSRCEKQIAITKR